MMRLRGMSGRGNFGSRRNLVVFLASLGHSRQSKGEHCEHNRPHSGPDRTRQASPQGSVLKYHCRRFPPKAGIF